MLRLKLIHISHIFFNYNCNSCWIDCFLFICKHVIMPKFTNEQFNKSNIEKKFASLLQDISSLNNKEVYIKGIWEYIINNPNYSNEILCDKKYIMRQSSCVSLFNKFKKVSEFCIKYKKLFHCDICLNSMVSSDEISSPIFSIDDEDMQLGDFTLIYKHRYSSFCSGCSNYISNGINSNAYVLISNLNFPTFLIIALEFNGFNPDERLTESNLKKGIIYSKKLFKRKIFLDSNDEKICYN